MSGAGYSVIGRAGRRFFTFYSLVTVFTHSERKKREPDELFTVVRGASLVQGLDGGAERTCVRVRPVPLSLYYLDFKI